MGFSVYSNISVHPYMSSSNHIIQVCYSVLSNDKQKSEFLEWFRNVISPVGHFKIQNSKRVVVFLPREYSNNDSHGELFSLPHFGLLYRKRLGGRRVQLY